MYRSMRELVHFVIESRKREAGTVYDFLFHDTDWHIAHVVVDTGTWIPDRKVLLEPETLGAPDWTRRSLAVSLTKEEIEQAPGLVTAEPLSEQMRKPEKSPTRWIPYWTTQSSAIQPYPIPIIMPDGIDVKAEDRHQHLRSFHEVLDYRIEARDGHIGHVEDFILEVASWKIVLMVVDTRRWLPGRHVPIPTRWVKDISWDRSEVRVQLNRETIQNGPEYDRESHVDLAFLQALDAHYQKSSPTAEA